MNEQGRKAQEIGESAERRVIETAQSLGYKVVVSSQLDYSKKTDCVIEGVAVQISCSPKSSNQMKILKNRGITSIVAGEHISNKDLVNSINSLFLEF